MSDITRKDVESFGKVLRRLGRLLEKHPEKLLELLAPLEQREPAEAAGPERRDPTEAAGAEPTKFPELDDVPIFEMAKERGRDSLLEYLGRYDAEQLRYLIRRFRFGALKSKSTQVLAEHIADQASKRVVDVFSPRK